MPGPFLAHSWGWDEAVYFAVPVIGALMWVRWIEKRATARKAAAAEEAARDEGEGEGPAANMARPEQS